MASASHSLTNTVGDSNKKLFSVGLHVLNEMHERFPGLQQSDMRIVWFGAGSQGQLPVLFGMYPEAEYEIHTQRACPVSAEVLQSLKVSYHDTSFEECLCRIEGYQGTQKFAVLLDVDYHIKPNELSARNKAKIAPSVESESLHYDRYMARYNAAYARLSRCSHVLLVSTPFRLPWLTDDFAANARRASWIDAELPLHKMRCPDVVLFPQFGSRVKSTELRGLLTTAGGYRECVIDWHKIDKSMYKTSTETHELSRAKFMLAQLERYKALAAGRPKTGNLCMREWSDAFVGNSIDEMREVVQGLESRNNVGGIYKEHSVSEWSGDA
jgi:hypothetical protein